jgi:imidazolonepropionase-like amidohydrolase
MPGLVDGHSHLSFLEKADVVDTGFVPVEEHTLQTMHNARRVSSVASRRAWGRVRPNRASTS